MTDKLKPYLFELELDGSKDATYSAVSEAGGPIVEVVDRDGDDGVRDWFREVLAAGSQEAEPYKRDLILRETELEPGMHYDNPDDPLDLTMVAAYRDGTRRVFIWCDRGQADELAQPGDIVLRGVYPIAYRRGPLETDDGVVVEELELEGSKP